LLIIAESLAHTHLDNLGKRVFDEHQILLKSKVHFGHINLVHCLSYSENWLLEDMSQKKKGTKRGGGVDQGGVGQLTKKKPTNCGTPQFWRVLSCLALEQNELTLGDENFEGSFAHLGGQDHKLRLHHKMQVLQTLNKNNIVLMDLSPVPLYLGASRIFVDNKKTGIPYHTPADKWSVPEFRNMIKIAWDLYCRLMLLECKPKAILVLGKRVFNSLTAGELNGVATEIGCVNEGFLPHPSTPTMQGKRYIPHFKKTIALARQQVFLFSIFL
jgi:hypothetical protein